MIWVDRVVKKIKERSLPLEWVDDMKTPSGRIHVGSLRGVIIHDLVYKVLKENGINAQFSYVFNDMDPMDAIPSYLDFHKWEKYAGMPLNKIPSPEKGFSSFASYYAQEFIEVFQKLNCYPKIIWSSKLYQSGKMDLVVRKLLNHADKIREIYKRVAKAEKPNDWYPYQVICQKCGRLGTTKVYRWDGKYVYYQCLPHYVAWAKGCGYQGKVEPIKDHGKLVWKVDWPAHWKVIRVTIESSGKDHMSAGGSYDIASHIAKEILEINPPEAFGGYEWFTVGGRKMSSSKGIGSSAKEVSEILPPSVFRFFIVRAPIETHIDFYPYGDTLLNIFDDYDSCLNAYFDKLEKKIPQGKKGEVVLNFARIIELSQVNPLPKKRIFLPRFRTVVNLLKGKSDILEFFTRKKGEELTDEEKKILEERIKYAKIYLERYSHKLTSKGSLITKSSFSLTEDQRKFLCLLTEKLKQMEGKKRDEIQQMIFSIIKENNFKPKEVFIGFYQILINQNFGPKAADLILEVGIKETIKKIEKVI